MSQLRVVAIAAASRVVFLYFVSPSNLYRKTLCSTPSSFFNIQTGHKLIMYYWLDKTRLKIFIWYTLHLFFVEKFELRTCFKLLLLFFAWLDLNCLLYVILCCLFSHLIQHNQLQAVKNSCFHIWHLFCCVLTVTRMYDVHL